jgi:hypothetical protein
LVRSRARRRAWRSAGVNGMAPRRGLGMISALSNRDCHVCQLAQAVDLGCFWLIVCQFFVWSGKAVLRPVACDRLPERAQAVKGPKR